MKGFTYYSTYFDGFCGIKHLQHNYLGLQFYHWIRFVELNLFKKRILLTKPQINLMIPVTYLVYFTVNGKLRVIRSCGWLNSTHEDDGKSCFQRSGSQDVYITHCTCFGDGCNGSSSLFQNFDLKKMIPILLGALYCTFGRRA